MHRVISDLSDLVGSGEAVLLAGDFNVTTQPYRSGDPAGWWRRQDQTVFDRLAALGMIDLVAAHLPEEHRGPEGCPCADPGCRHVRTTRHMRQATSTPYQNDWAFASTAFAERVTSCRVVDEEVCWAASDHAPICPEVQL